ncbi:MAG: serine hydrolase, partial [Planctomycetota bacterium]
MHSRTLVSVLVLSLLVPAPDLSAGESWSEFRGPNGSGVAEDCYPPTHLPNSRSWNVDVPAGQSSPVLTKDLVVLTGIENGVFSTLAYRVSDGSLAWRREAPKVELEKVHRAGSPAASTPCVDEERIYVYFGSYGLLCYDHSGEPQWSREIPTPKSMYGTSTCPVVFDGRVILVVDNDQNLPKSRVSQSKIIAFDAKTGVPAWETARPFHRSGWSTPTIWKHDQGVEVVVLGNGRLRGYDARSGEEKWYVNGFSRETVARPICGDGIVLASASMLGGVADEQPDPEPFWQAVLRFDANEDKKLERKEMTKHFTFPFRPDLPIDHPGFGMPLPKDPNRRARRLDGMFQGIDKDKDGFWSRDEFLSRVSFRRGKPNLIAVRPGGKGDATESHVSWSLHRSIPEVPSPLYYKKRVYMIRNGGILACVDASSGKIVYRKRIPGASGHYTASPICAGGNLYVVSERGVVSVVRAGDQFELVHQHPLSSRVDASPAVDTNSIYLRTEGKLLAFRVPLGSRVKGPSLPVNWKTAKARATSRLMKAALNGDIVGGLHMAVKDGRVIHLETIGTCDLDEPEKLFKEDTILRIYSMTKPITSVAAMMLYEQGKFGLDDPVSRFIPAFSKLKVLRKDGSVVPANKTLTIRDLFRHTSGYSYGDGLPLKFYERSGVRYRPPVQMMPPLLTIEKAAEALATVPILHEPGERFTYGLNTDILGRLIEIWSGQRLDEFLSEQIFRPLGMTDTGFKVLAKDVDRFAACHSRVNGKLVVVDKAKESPFVKGFEFLSGG